MKELINHLKQNIGIVHDRFPRINCGGCGEFAILLYTKLLELGIEAECVLLVRGTETTKIKLDNYLNTGNEASLTWYNGLLHVVIKVGEYYIDAEGVHTAMCDLGYYRPSHFTIDIESLVHINAYTEGWNPAYDRTLTPKVKKTLDKIFESVLVEHNPDAEIPMTIMIGATGRGKTVQMKSL